jgi:hypothetical protein
MCRLVRISISVMVTLGMTLSGGRSQGHLLSIFTAGRYHSALIMEVATVPLVNPLIDMVLALTISGLHSMEVIAASA